MHLHQRKRRDGTMVLTGNTRSQDDVASGLPDFFDFGFQMMYEERTYPATVKGDTIVLEYANARATYQIVGALRVPLLTLPEKPTPDEIALLRAQGKIIPDVLWDDDHGYLYEERPGTGHHAVLVPDSVEVFDPPPIDEDKAAAIAAVVAAARKEEQLAAARALVAAQEGGA